MCVRLITPGLATIMVTISASAGNSAPNLLLLTKSSGHEHTTVKETGGNPSLVETVVSGLAADLGYTITHTKDASIVNATDLQSFDIVFFFTSGDLTTAGADGQTPMGPDGVDDLLAWIADGGAFVGVHSTSDTFHRVAPEFESPFLDMLGAEFDVHATQFEGTVQVVAPNHPIMAGFPASWVRFEEWYLFKNVDLSNYTVLAMFDPCDYGQTNPLYDLDPYPIVWAGSFGNGRVFYSQMAHREDTWEDPTFQSMLRNALAWAAQPATPLPAPSGRTAAIIFLGLIAMTILLRTRHRTREHRPPQRPREA